MNKNFTQEHIHMTNKHMRKCQISLVIRRMQFGTKVSYYFMPIGMSEIKKADKMLKMQRNWNSHIAGGIAKRYNHFENSFTVS